MPKALRSSSQMRTFLSIYAQLTRNTWLKIIVASVHLYYILAAMLALSFNHS